MILKGKLIALSSIVEKEIIRILRIWPQTIIPPIITTSLYFIIFGEILFKDKIVYISGNEIPYTEYLISGLIMMSIITNSFDSTVSSFFGCKFQKNIEELIVSPTPVSIIILGFSLGGILRGLINGFMIYIVANFFHNIEISSIYWSIIISILISNIFSMAGILNAIFAKHFDDISWFPLFILTPMVYLGGVFFSLEMLSGIWKTIILLNPIYHFVTIFRYYLLGIGNSNWIAVANIAVLNVILFSLNVYYFKKKMIDK